MQFYDFMEALFSRGADIGSICIESADPGLSDETVSHTKFLVEEFARKTEEYPEAHYSGTRRFGFDKHSYIGDLSVLSVRKKLTLRRGQVSVGLGRPKAEW
jgi:hypothetical protein